MSQQMNEMLESAPSTDELMDVDTSFLDACRRGGREELKRLQVREAQQQTQLDTGEHDEETPQPGTETAPLAPDHDDELNSEPALEPDHEPEAGDDSRAGEAGQHGGGTGAAGSSGEMIPGAPPQEDTVDAAPLVQEEVDGDDVADAGLNEDAVVEPMLPHAESGIMTPGSLRLTDHQEAVQSSTTSTKGGSGSSGDGAVFPQSGFRLSGVKSQPSVRALPDVVMNALREQLRSAAVRELDVDDTAARAFSERLSQASLVTAFLLAQLDLSLEVDAATRRAAQLFRSRDPLLGSVAARLDGLERLEVEKRELLDTLREELAEVRQTAAVVEQAVAYSIADRTENFLRGSHNIHDAPITHKDAMFVRDRAREATKTQAKLEREREGRPIR